MSRNRAKKDELIWREQVAIDIFNRFGNSPEYTREDVCRMIREELKVPAWTVNRIVLKLNLYSKRMVSTAFNRETDNPNTLICPKCLQEKDKTDFPKKGKNKNGEIRYSYCKSCHREYQKVLHIKRQFNLTMDEYNSLGTSCFMCGRTGKTKQNAVDHDHTTGLIRGRLCDRCNRGLAWFQDNPDLLSRGAEYLKNPPAIKIIGKRYGRTGRVNKRRGKRKIYKRKGITA